MEDLQFIEVAFNEDGETELEKCVIFRKETHGDFEYLLIAPADDFLKHQEALDAENIDVDVEVFKVKKHKDVDFTTEFLENLEINEEDDAILNYMFENFCEDNGVVAYYE